MNETLPSSPNTTPHHHEAPTPLTQNQKTAIDKFINQYWQESSGISPENTDNSSEKYLDRILKYFGPTNATELYNNHDEFKHAADAIITNGLISNNKNSIRLAVEADITLGKTNLDEIIDKSYIYHFHDKDPDIRLASKTAALSAALNIFDEKRDAKGELPPSEKNNLSYFARDFLSMCGYEDPSPIISNLMLQKKPYRLLEYVDIAEELDRETIRTLQTECGIVNLANYPTDMLKKQSDWLHGDPTAIAYFSSKQNPSTLIITDGINDHNSAFTRIAGSIMHATNQAPVLVFEVGGINSTIDGLKKYRAILSEKQPYISTLVIGGHGSDNGTGILFGDKRLVSRAFQPHAELVWEEGDMAALLRSVQPDNFNIRTILIESCSQGKPGHGGVAESVATTSHPIRTGDSTTTKVFAYTQPSRLITKKGVITDANGNDALISVETDGTTYMRRKSGYGENGAIFDQKAYRENLKTAIANTLSVPPPTHTVETTIVRLDKPQKGNQS
jgi:hypothetical protein